MSNLYEDPPPQIIEARCKAQWVLDPGPQGAADQITHHCDLGEHHNGPHRCVCGDSILILKP